MGKIIVKYNSFKAGELSPRLSFRIDLDYYDDGCKVLENMIVKQQGAVMKRPGTELIATAGGDWIES